MDIRHLRYFVAIADLGGFTKAAGELRIAQPALSRAIRNLEFELSAKLFDRDRHGATLTHAGRRLRAHAERILDNVEVARLDVGAASKRIEGIVDIGMPASVGLSLGTRVMERLTHSNPGLRIHLVEAYGGDLQVMLLSGRVDIAVLNSRTVGKQRLRVEPLLEDEMHVFRARAIAPGHPRKNPISLRELVNERLILPTRTHGLRLLVDEYAAGLKLRIAPALEIDSVLIVREMVARGMGIAILPLPVMQREVQSGLVDALPLDPPLRRKLVIAMPEKRSITPAVRACAEALHAEAESAGKTA